MPHHPPALPCNRDRLVRSLEDALPECEEEQLVEHLSSCVSCQEELERLAAEKPDWTRVGTALREEGSGASPYDGPSGPSRAHGDARTSGDDRDGPEGPSYGGGGGGSGHDDTLADFAVDFLAPALTEESIGRLDGIDILEVIGRGGMGVVLKGFEEELNRPVVVKMLAPHLASSGAARKRFAREAQAAAVIVHPNVMPILTVNSTGRLPYLVMPFMACESLQQRIDREGPLETLDVLRIAHQMVCGLAAAHAQGLVHRDVKPANILLERGVDRVLLTDFGLARAADDASLTRTGVIAGTPQFMSPEQARGEAVDARSDLFCLGSVMYVLCAGRPPFRAETSYGVLRRITDEEPRPLRELNPTIPDWLAGIVARLHSKQPDERFQSAEELAELLEKCLAHVQQPDAVPLPEAAQAAAKSLRNPNPKRQRGDRSGPDRSGTEPRSRFGLGLVRVSMLAGVAAVCVAAALIANPSLFDTSRDTAPVSPDSAAFSEAPPTRPFSPGGEGARRADEGDSQATTKPPYSASETWHDDVAPGLVDLREETVDLEERAGRLWDNRRIRATPLNFGETP